LRRGDDLFIQEREIEGVDFMVPIDVAGQRAKEVI
jgi:hypothetical protein